MSKIFEKEPRVVAEIGCNHKGDFDIAIELVKVASLSGAAAVKFQKRNNKELFTKEEYNAPHPNQSNSYGKTYGEHRDNLEFSLEQHKKLKEYCDEIGIIYSTSVWDITSAKEIASLKPEFIKIPSASNQHYEMLEYLCKNYDGQIQISVGMTTRKEEEEIVSFFKKHGREKDLFIYSCTSGYPVPFEDICLLEITRLRETYSDKVAGIGFSGHHLGIAADIAAITLGAEWVERHFTLDRTWKGTDHAASLEPDGLRRVCRDIKAVYKALTYKSQEVLPIEQVQRDKLKWVKKK